MENWEYEALLFLLSADSVEEMQEIVRQEAKYSESYYFDEPLIQHIAGILTSMSDDIILQAYAKYPNLLSYAEEGVRTYGCTPDVSATLRNGVYLLIEKFVRETLEGDDND